jgi:hypothetical protein
MIRCALHVLGLTVYGPLPTGVLSGYFTGLEIFDQTCFGTIGVWPAT